MLKIPRFMKEYANYMKKQLAENDLMDGKVKSEWINGLMVLMMLQLAMKEV